METAPTYLVVIDSSAESRVALRFAALRAAHVGARLALVCVIAPAEFMQWGGVQQALAEEARVEAEALLATHAEAAETLSGTRPATVIVEGEAGPAIYAHVCADRSVRALVLAAAPKGVPGPLINFFTGERAGQLPCIVIIVPGGLAADRLDSLT